MNPLPKPEPAIATPAPLAVAWVAPDDWPALLPEWQSLADQDHRGGFFAGPAFTLAFAKIFADRARCDLLTLREGGRLVGLLPMMQTRVRRGRGLTVRHDYLAEDHRLLAQPGHRPIRVSQRSPLLGLEASVLSSHILCMPNHVQRVWTTVAAALCGCPDWSLAVFPAATDALKALSVGAQVFDLPHHITRIDRPMQALDPVLRAADLIAAQSQKFRQNMRRASNFAAQAGTRIALLQDDDARAALPEFADLAARSWKASPVSTRTAGEAVVVPYTDRQRAMAETLAAHPNLRPVLAVATNAAGAMRAACLAFATPTLLTTYVMVQDAEAGRESLGHMVLHQLIDHAAAEGLARLDYNANSGWLTAYVNATELVQSLTLFSPGIKGRTLSLFAKLTGET